MSAMGLGPIPHATRVRAQSLVLVGVQLLRDILLHLRRWVEDVHTFLHPLLDDDERDARDLAQRLVFSARCIRAPRRRLVALRAVRVQIGRRVLLALHDELAALRLDGRREVGDGVDHASAAHAGAHATSSPPVAESFGSMMRDVRNLIPSNSMRVPAAVLAAMVYTVADPSLIGNACADSTV